MTRLLPVTRSTPATESSASGATRRRYARCWGRGSTSYGEEFAQLIHHAYPSHDHDDLMSAVDAVAGTFDRGAVVRRAEEYHLFQAFRPCMTGFQAVVGCASGDQPAHAVAQDDQLFDRHRPVGHQALQHFVEIAPVVGDVPAGVVMKVDGRIAVRDGKTFRQAAESFVQFVPVFALIN